MKGLKNIWFVTLMLFSSCGNDREKIDNPINVPSSKEISFSVGSISDSRATIMDNSNFVADGRTIGVFANKHIGNLGDGSFSANVMKNEELVYCNGIWSYSPLQYWSESTDTLYSFVAYAPFGINATSNSSGVVIKHNNALENTEQTDLLYAVTKNVNTPRGAVSLDFKHALSKVTFNVSGNINEFSISGVDITSIRLKGLYSCADLLINSYSGAVSWSNFSNVANVDVNDTPISVKTAKQQLGEPLLLIPQSLSNARIIVNYNIVKNGNTQTESKSVEFALSTVTTTEWLANKQYAYNLQLDLSSVDFSVTVSDFDSTITIPIDVPRGENYGNPPVDSGFISPEADYVLDVKVVQDNSWACTYFALDGTDVTGWSKYEDETTYITLVNGVSVDITAEIEAALGLEIGTLKDELLAGNVLLGSYNANNEFMDCYEVHGSNYFFWFDADGSALSQYAGYACIDNLGFVGDEVRLYGTTCLMPNKAVAGTTYSTYIVFKNLENEYIVQINMITVNEPDKIKYSVVGYYGIMYKIPYTDHYMQFAGDEYNLDGEMIESIESLVGGEVDKILMQAISENGVITYEDLSLSDGWFGDNGIAFWGNGAKVNMKPIDVLFPYEFLVTTHPDSKIGDVAKCVYQYCCSATKKAVNIEYVVTIVEPE